MENIAEVQRLINNLVRLGTIAEIDTSAARVRVQSGDLLTNWIPWLANRAGDTRVWNPPTVGEQVIILSESGDLTNAVALTGLFSMAHAAPTHDAGKTQQVYPDGATIEYDHDAHVLRADIPGDIHIHATGDITIKADGNTTITGNRVDLNP